MTGRLRAFLYRDDDIVSQFLEQLEEGAYTEESIHREVGGGSSIGGRVSAGPLAAGASRNRSVGESSELTVQQTGSSRYNRFYRLATDEEEVQSLDALDDAIWDQIEVGEVFEARVSLSVSDILRSLSIAGQATALLPMMNLLTGLRDDDGNPLVNSDEFTTVEEKLPLIAHFASMQENRPIPLLATLVSDNRYKFFCRLNRGKVIAPSLQDFDGEARLVAIVDSKIAQGQTERIGQLLPELVPSNRQQRRHGGTGSQSDSDTVVLRYPSCTATPIAIHR